MQYVWDSVDVHWCAARRWVVRAVEPNGREEYIDDFGLLADAIEEAKLYAFSTDCGPQRGKAVQVFTKANVLKTTIKAA